ncbi:30878_t:CDS:1, partial [Racocetra persica]
MTIIDSTKRDKNLNTKIRAKTLRPKKRKRLENDQTIFISKKMIKIQQTNSETLVAKKKNLLLSLLKSNTSEITLQDRTTLGQPNLEHTSRLSKNWADEFEEVSRTQHRVQLNSTMVNNKEPENSLANSYKTKADGGDKLMAENAENQVIDTSDQVQPQLVSKQTAFTDISHMETYDTDTNIETDYTNPNPSSSYGQQRKITGTETKILHLEIWTKKIKI